MTEENFLKEYKRLNPEQKKAVDTIEGPVMVNAGPGTGKTQILTLRIANILKQTDIRPENILALTFTNSGVYAMRERLHTYIGDESYHVNIFTFHAFCEHIIKKFPLYFTQFEYAQVIDDLQKVKIIEKIIDSNSFSHVIGKHDRYLKIREITDAINSIKQEGYTPESFLKSLPQWKEELMSDPNIYYSRKYKQYAAGDIKPNEEKKILHKIAQAQEIALIYEEYQKEIFDKRLYDFSDMVLTVVRELKQNADFKFEVQEQYQYILVDEHQDTNMGQNELIELLTDAEHLDGHPNIFTVGDEKQSIYRFQGASEETFSHFKTIYKDITYVDLKTNYRSTQAILDVSGVVIEHSMENPVHLEAFSKDVYPLELGEFSNYKFELLYMAQSIKQKIDSGVDPKEIAVLFRANKHTEDIKLVLTRFGIPFTIFSKDSIFKNFDIKNILLLIRIILDPHNEELLGRALFINFLNIDGYDAIKILQKRTDYKKEFNKSFFEMLRDVEYLKSITVSSIESIQKFTICITQSIVSSQNTTVVDFLKDFLKDSGFMSYALSHDLSRDKLSVIDKLFDEIKKQQSHKDFSIEDFISLVDSYYAYNIDIENSHPEVEAGVQLMTNHGSKGKEFEYVYMINAISKNWEKNRGFGGISLPIKKYKGDEHDERRLFYVALTRAKKGICIIYSKTDWEGKEQEKTRFIGEMPPEYFTKINTPAFEKESLKDIALFVEPVKQKNSIYDTEYIKELFISKGLNVTALNNYYECPLKYFYKNLIQIPSGYSANMLYGTLMHAALEKFFVVSKQKEKLASKKDLLSYFDLEIEHAYFRDKIEKEMYHKRGLGVLEEWLDHNKDTLTWNTSPEVSIKRNFELSEDVSIILNGKIDKLEFLNSSSEGLVNVIDYKTGKTFSEKNKKQKADLTRQLIFYHILLETYREGVYQINQAVLDFLEKNKKDEHERYTVPVSAEEIQNLMNDIKDVSRDIMSGEFLKKGCSKKDCEWCQFGVNN
jgi:DNA helicase II / ATP-dependent DNA helicase PcrA